MTYQHDSSFYFSQSYQSIITNNHYLTNVLVLYVVIKTSVHYHLLCKILKIFLHWYCLQSSLSGPQKRNFQIGSACIVSKNSCNLLKLINLLAFVMKCLLLLIQFSSLAWISRHLLFVSPVNWLAQSAVCLKSTNQLMLNKKIRSSVSRCPWSWPICLCCPMYCQHSRQTAIGLLQTTTS